MYDARDENKIGRKKGHQTINLRHELEAIFSSPVWSEIRGSIGGTTYSRVRAGAIARNRTKPVNPSTPNQALVRSRVATLSDAFNGLTIGNIDAWNQFAQAYPFKNALGEEYIPTAKQVYFLCNLNLLSIGGATITEPPYEVPIVPGVDVEGGNVTAEISVSPGIVDLLEVDAISTDYTPASFIIQGTPPLQPSRAGYKNKFRQLRVVANETITAQSILSDFNSYFGNPNASEGQIIKVRVAAVAEDSGLSSGWFDLPPAVVAVNP